LPFSGGQTVQSYFQLRLVKTIQLMKENRLDAKTEMAYCGKNLDRKSLAQRSI